MNPVKKFFVLRKWKKQGKPMLHYSGFNCGCCGKRWDIPFSIPTYESCGKWWDTWGVCPIGKGCNRGEL